MSEATITELGWYADPTERHGRRFHDGRRWTDYVTDGDSVVLDPLHPPVPRITTWSEATPHLRERSMAARRPELLWKIMMVALLAIFLGVSAITTLQ